jgi:hypothetical protein
VFLSKIWFFVLALAAAAAATVALVMPRPAQRTLVSEEHARLGVACGVIDILLADNARSRVELAGAFARAPELVTALENASNADRLDEVRSKQVRELGEKLIDDMKGSGKPDFAWLIDRRGRVIASAKSSSADAGDVVAGRPLVDDALSGYLRDDLWSINGTLYLVAAAPVVKRDPPVAYAGAVLLGHKVTNDLAQKLVQTFHDDKHPERNIELGFFLGNDDVASSQSTALDHKSLADAVGKLTGNELAKDCQADTFDLTAGNDQYTAVVGRLPGEARGRGAFFSVYMKQPVARGFTGTLGAVDKQDLSFAHFPWLVVGGMFVLVLAAGIGFMWLESDRPLKRLAADAVKLAKNEQERLREDAHGGKYGSIARSVNIHIDKVGRDAKSARTNLDQLLGPAPEGSLGTIDLLAGGPIPTSPLPTSRPGGPAPAFPPPPSDFRFGDATPPPGPPPRPSPPARPPTPAPMRPMPAPAPPMPIAQAPSAPLRLDDDILAPTGTTTPPPMGAGVAVDPYFKQVYDQFLAVKKSCSEPTTGLTYQKFAEKLVRNRDELIAKTGCRDVRFTVYVKDGKAALKATPVKDA